MTLPLHCHLASMFLLLLFLSMVFVDANFTVSETAYYPNSVDGWMQTVNLTCQLPPLSIRMLFNSRAPRSGDQKWLVPTNIIPQNCTAGAIYDSGVQVQLYSLCAFLNCTWENKYRTSNLVALLQQIGNSKVFRIYLLTSAWQHISTVHSHTST